MTMQLGALGTLVAPPPVLSAGPIVACYEPLLRALHWRGSARTMAEAMTTRENMDLLDIRNTMANLSFASETEATRLDRIDPRLLPCLFLPATGGALVVMEPGEAPGSLLCFDGVTGATRVVENPRGKGVACFFNMEHGRGGIDAKPGWFAELLGRFETGFWRLLGLSFFLNILALTPTFFVQAVYDRVLATREIATLTALAMGVALALLCDTILRVLRGVALAQIGSRLDFLIGSLTVRKLFSLPLARLEKAAVGAQISRLREFENLRAIFIGPLAMVCLELPFAFLSIILVALIGGWLALVPVVLSLALIGLGLVGLRYARRWADKAVVTLGDHQTLLVEILSNMRAIKGAAGEAIWLERFRERSAQMALAQLRRARISALAETLAHAVNMVAGAATLAIGTIMALNGAITIGTLIAGMALVWRILAPVQILFLTLSRIDEIRAAVQGIDAMMALPSEGTDAGDRPSTVRARRLAGKVSFQRVLMRYSPHHDPALAGVSFEIQPGEVVAITGGNGSGKSSVLKLIAGLYQAQMGVVLLDGVEVRQINPIDLRQAIAYLPQQSDLFGGTVGDNLRLVAPMADTGELRNALAKAGALGAVESLPQGLDTPIDDAVASSIGRKLTLARTYLIDAGLVLLDEPAPERGPDGEDLLVTQINALRGRSTVLLVTHNQDYVRIADRVIVLRQGSIVHDGTPQQLMTRLSGGKP